MDTHSESHPLVSLDDVSCLGTLVAIAGRADVAHALVAVITTSLCAPNDSDGSESTGSALLDSVNPFCSAGVVSFLGSLARSDDLTAVLSSLESHATGLLVTRPSAGTRPANDAFCGAVSNHLAHALFAAQLLSSSGGRGSKTSDAEAVWSSYLPGYLAQGYVITMSDAVVVDVDAGAAGGGGGGASNGLVGGAVGTERRSQQSSPLAAPAAVDVAPPSFALAKAGSSTAMPTSTAAVTTTTTGPARRPSAWFFNPDVAPVAGGGVGAGSGSSSGGGHGHGHGHGHSHSRRRYPGLYQHSSMHQQAKVFALLLELKLGSDSVLAARCVLRYCFARGYWFVDGCTVMRGRGGPLVLAF